MDEPAWKILVDRARTRLAARVAPLRERLSTRPLVVVAGAVAAMVVAALAGWWLLRPPSPAPELSLPQASTTTQPPAPGSAPPGASPTSAPDGPVVVDMVGAVVRPGLVKLASGSRVADALAAAGGPSPDADLERLNAAAPLADGERIYVPHVGETSIPVAVNGSAGGGSANQPAGSGTGSSAPTAPVDLNAATADQLVTLPGVGPATAQAILDYRQQHGPFRSVDDLLNVRGIGPAKLAALRPRVRV